MDHSKRKLLRDLKKGSKHLKGHTKWYEQLKFLNNVMFTPNKIKAKTITLHVDSLVIRRRAFLASMGKLMRQL